jgi:hypothetical protein
LSYNEKARIARDAVLGVELSSSASDAEKAWRAELDHDVKAARDAGFMVDLPFDWDPEDRVEHQND